MTAPDAPPTALRATGLGFRYRSDWSNWSDWSSRLGWNPRSRRNPRSPQSPQSRPTPRDQSTRPAAWALRDCEFTVPRGRITALVGRNGVGKSTLLHLAGGLLRPGAGEIRVLDTVPGTPAARTRVALVTQDKPLYPRFTVAETLRLGARLNPTWDPAAAERLVAEGDIPLTARLGELSPGRRTRVALALALGKRPELLLLDEPMADLDPVVRGQIMAALMTEAAEYGTSIVLSSHVLPELEQTCDWVLLLRDGRAALCEDADALREAHVLLTGRADRAGDLADHIVVRRSTSGRQLTALIRPCGPLPGGWHVERPRLEDVLMGHLRADDPGPIPGAPAEVAA